MRQVHRTQKTNDDNALIQSLRIAAPCNVDWDSMTGDERKRLCGQCKLNVYNIERMTPSEAASLIRGKQDICIQLYRRKDGTILTENCPVGLRKIRDRLKKCAATIAVFTVWIGFAKSAQADDLERFYERGKRVVSPQILPPKKPANSATQNQRWCVREPVSGPRVIEQATKPDSKVTLIINQCETPVVPKPFYNANQLLALFLASILSVFGTIFLVITKRSRPSTIGAMLLAIWALTGFLLGVLSTPH